MVHTGRVVRRRTPLPIGQWGSGGKTPPDQGSGNGAPELPPEPVVPRRDKSTQPDLIPSDEVPAGAGDPFHPGWTHEELGAISQSSGREPASKLKAAGQPVA